MLWTQDDTYTHTHLSITHAHRQRQQTIEREQKATAHRPKIVSFTGSFITFNWLKGNWPRSPSQFANKTPNGFIKTQRRQKKWFCLIPNGWWWWLWSSAFTLFDFSFVPLLLAYDAIWMREWKFKIMSYWALITQNCDNTIKPKT